jgi:hypothetical protein
LGHIVSHAIGAHPWLDTAPTDKLNGMTERDLIDPTPELPDDTPIDCVRFPTRIRNVLTGSGMKTVGEVRETTNETLLTY